MEVVTKFLNLKDKSVETRTIELQLRKEVRGDTTYWFYPMTHQLHRLDGPAVESSSGYKAWYCKGVLHRLDGPAIEYPDGSTSWYCSQ